MKVVNRLLSAGDVVVSSIFERRPPEYESHAPVAPYNAPYDRPATLSLLGDVGGRLILDAGCGPGPKAYR